MKVKLFRGMRKHNRTQVIHPFMYSKLASNLTQFVDKFQHSALLTQVYQRFSVYDSYPSVNIYLYILYV